MSKETVSILRLVLAPCSFLVTSTTSSQSVSFFFSFFFFFLPQTMTTIAVLSVTSSSKYTAPWLNEGSSQLFDFGFLISVFHRILLVPPWESQHGGIHINFEFWNQGSFFPLKEKEKKRLSFMYEKSQPRVFKLVSPTPPLTWNSTVWQTYQLGITNRIFNTSTGKFL